MFSLLFKLATSLFYLALHVTGAGSFPPPLKPEEEALLLQKTQEGDFDARNRLIEHNLRLVAHIVKKYYATGAESDDLISIGTIGLIKAVSTFKSDKNIKFATYAARCIENEILMFFRNQKKSSQDVFINDPIETDKDGNNLTLIDIIADNCDIVDEIDTKMKLDKLKILLSSVLSEREREIIEMRYGIGGKEELTQREIAKKFGISRSYVSRIEKSALETLKRNF